MTISAPICRSSAGPHQPTAFTLVEMLIVIAIMGIVMTIGIPAFRETRNQDALQKTVSGILEGCAHARAQAIFTGEPAELRFSTIDRQLSSTGFEVIIPGEIFFEGWAVNFRELKDAERSVIRFYPNGTSDEFMTIFRSTGNRWRKISLDVITGHAEMDVIR